MGANVTHTVVDYYLTAAKSHYFLPSLRDGLQPLLNFPDVFNSTGTQQAEGSVPKYKES